MGSAKDERRRLVCGCLGRLFGERARTPRDYADQAWANEEWTRGCYGAFMAPGAWTDNGPALKAAVGRLHWAGTETAERWSGYMDGAVASGERAAAEVLALL